MAFERRNMTGALFKNKDKGNEKHPDYRGYVKVGDVEYDLAAWIKKPQSGGDKYMSMSVRVHDEQHPRSSEDQAPPPSRDFDDDIPF